MTVRNMTILGNYEDSFDAASMDPNEINLVDVDIVVDGVVYSI